MNTQSTIRFWLLAVALVTSSVLAGAFAPQSNRGGGVDVKVTPRTLAADAAAWEFEVVFSTHSVTLTGDPAQFSVLVDAKGGEHKALAWQGDAPGSHHRQGLLRYKPLVPATPVELRIKGVGGVPTRVFRWNPG
jgi:hypothetical protein